MRQNLHLILGPLPLPDCHVISLPTSVLQIILHHVPKSYPTFLNSHSFLIVVGYNFLSKTRGFYKNY